MLTDLSLTPIATVFRQLAADGLSGDLQVRNGPIVKTVFFDHGRVVFGASNLKRDRLGEALVALGQISDEDFRRASQLMRDQKKRIGEALVAAGVLDKAELGTSVARQVRKIALSLFEFEDGAAMFEERRCPIPLEYMVSISIHRLLYDGILAMNNPELVQAGLGSLDRQVCSAPLPPFQYKKENASGAEKDILKRAADKPTTIRALAWSPGGLRPERLRSVYALWASGVIRDAQADEAEDQPAVQTETGMFLLSALRNRPDPPIREAIKLEIQQELARSARLDREQWLRVSRAAPREELIRALNDKIERYQGLLATMGDDASARTDIELILGRASSLLRLTRQDTGGAAGEPSSVPPGSVQGATGPGDVPSGEVPAQAEPGSFPPGDMAASSEPPSLPPGEVPITEEPASIPPGEGPDAANAMPPGEAAEIARTRAGYLLMEAEVRMTVADYANAVKVYAQLVELAPEVPAYRARLAIAMACYPRTAKQAEREFLEAIRLDPKNADYHYQLGLYYKTMRLRARAVIEMRAALNINPRHTAAREELEILSPKDTALKAIRKLFK